VVFRRVAFPLVVAAFVSVRAAPAAEPLPPPEPREQTSTSEDASQRPGRYRLGPFYFNPRLNIGSLGVDTNVFYTPTDRRADFSGSGGPGLEIVLPIRQNLRLHVEGGVGYVYFLRTTSQRRLTGDAAAGLSWLGTRTRFESSARYGRSFARPSPDVDRRTEQDVTTFEGLLRRRVFGRTTLELRGGVTRQEVATGQEFLGVDLGRTLSQEMVRGQVGLEYALTLKTQLASEVRWSRIEYPLAEGRDMEHLVAAGGLRTSRRALVAGRALVGQVWTRPVSEKRWRPRLYADVDATWNISLRTRLGAGYRRDVSHTAFAVVGVPSLQREVLSAFFEKDLPGNFDVRFVGRRIRMITDDPVRVSLDGALVEAVREDVAREGTGELGYRFRRSFRLGVLAGYSDRRSSIADLGVDGLLLGGTVRFEP
jgi:hypothetical protein